MFLLGFTWAADTPADTPAGNPGDKAISTCFKVRRLLKTDETHYWADWTNTCPFTIDPVYVMVRFLDGPQTLDDGVWPMYFILPGVHRVTRFSIPVGVEGFEFIRVRRYHHQLGGGAAIYSEPASRRNRSGFGYFGVASRLGRPRPFGIKLSSSSGPRCPRPSRTWPRRKSWACFPVRSRRESRRTSAPTPSALSTRSSIPARAKSRSSIRRPSSSPPFPWPSTRTE